MATTDAVILNVARLTLAPAAVVTVPRDDPAGLSTCVVEMGGPAVFTLDGTAALILPGAGGVADALPASGGRVKFGARGTHHPRNNELCDSQWRTGTARAALDDNG